MKRIILLLTLATFLFGCNNTAKNDAQNKESTQQEQTAINPDMVKQAEIKISGMTCTGCENTIKKGVGELDGMIEIQTSHTDGNAFVKFDESKVKIEDMAKAIEAKGYTYEGYTLVDSTKAK